MEKLIRKQSSFLYDESKNIDEVMKEYDEFLGTLSNERLKKEVEIRRTTWLSLPTIFNVRAYMRSKEKMLERESFIQASDSALSALELQ